MKCQEMLFHVGEGAFLTAQHSKNQVAVREIEPQQLKGAV